MKITPEWLKATDHCKDGLAFGLSNVPAAGLDLEECWPLIVRPDFAVALAVKAGALTYANARFSIERVLHNGILRPASEGGGVLCPETWAALHVLRNCPPSALSELRADIASSAYVAVAVKKMLGLGQRLNAVGQLAAADWAAITDETHALTLLQGAALSIGNTLGLSDATAAFVAYVRAFQSRDAEALNVRR